MSKNRKNLDRKAVMHTKPRGRPNLNATGKPPLLRKLANAEDEATGQAYEIVEFRKPLGRSGIERLPRDKARDPRQLSQHLVGRNWTAPFNRAKAEAIAERAIRRKPAERWLHAAHVGWWGNRQAFVLQTRVVGETGGRLILKPPLWLNSRQRLSIEVAGNLEDWIKRVAKPARFSSRLTLMLAATFAAPLLHLVGLQPFAINLFGRSKAGKSTALLAAASAIGIGREAQLPNLNTTDPAFHETARLFNDLIVPANEMGLIKGAKRDAYARMRGLIYAYAEGHDVARHSGSAFATEASSALHRGILIATAEHSTDRLAELASEVRDHGEHARCTDVPATAKGMRTIFDRKPSNTDASDFEAWARKKLVSVRRACAANPRVAIGPYLQYLIDLGGKAPAAVRAHMREFENALEHLDLSDGALQHAARNLSLIYAGGRLGIDAGLFP